MPDSLIQSISHECGYNSFFDKDRAANAKTGSARDADLHAADAGFVCLSIHLRVRVLLFSLASTFETPLQVDSQKAPRMDG